jgi:tyrosyl-tRNA synthetase
VLKANIANMKEQLRRFLDFDTKINRAVGGQCPLDRASRTRFPREIESIFSEHDGGQEASPAWKIARPGSATEFSYAAQALILPPVSGAVQVRAQIGGSDQWGTSPRYRPLSPKAR